MAAAPPEQGLVRRAEFRVETAHLCRRVDIHDGRQPAHRLPAGTGADHAAALPNPRRIRDDRRSRAVRLQRHAFARGTRSQPAGRLHRTGGIRAIRRHRHPVARHDHRPRPRRTGKYRHHHQSQPGSRPGTVRRHVVDRPRTLAVELVERHRRRLHDPRRRKAGDRHRSIAGHRVQHRRRRVGRASRQMEIPARAGRIRPIARRRAVSYGAIGRSSTIRRTTTARCAAFWTRSRRSA